MRAMCTTCRSPARVPIIAAGPEPSMQGGIKYLGWALTAASLAIYLVMNAVTLPHLADLAGGAKMFDLRPLGYDFATAQNLLTRLAADGAAYYENVQHRLESAFAVVFCLSL